MNCPKCKCKTRIIDKLYDRESNFVFRKRECLVCGFKFLSLEMEMTNIGDRTED